MVDKFRTQFPSFQSLCYTDAFVITPSDTLVLSQPPRAIFVGNTGNIQVQMLGTLNSDPTKYIFYNVPAGTILPIRVSMVLLDFTTATNLLGLL
ncbi:MAG: spike base protein, RCAP_Rcc01079 family [Candidatus Bathyarchaeia archaeon]